MVVYVLYLKKAFWKVPILYQLAYNGFYLDKIYMNIFVKFYDVLAKISDWIDRKVLANYSLCINGAKLGVNTSSFIENKIMNGAVNAISQAFKKLSILDLKAQSGNVQRYNAYAFIIVTAIITCLMLGYAVMLIYLEG